MTTPGLSSRRMCLSSCTTCIVLKHRPTATLCRGTYDPGRPAQWPKRKTITATFQWKVSSSGRRTREATERATTRHQMRCRLRISRKKNGQDRFSNFMSPGPAKSVSTCSSSNEWQWNVPRFLAMQVVVVTILLQCEQTAMVHLGIKFDTRNNYTLWNDGPTSKEYATDRNYWYC